MIDALAIAARKAVTRHQDGRWLHRFRQSDFSDLEKCLELSRRKIMGELDRWESDAACVGTAVHAAIETTLEDAIQFGSPLPLGDAVDVAQVQFSDLMADPNFRWIKMKEGGARAFINSALRVFYSDVLPDLRPKATEVAFGPLVLHEDAQRVIEVTGCVDYIDRIDGAKDWKTASNKYEKWEYQRWAVQPTMYLWALQQVGLIEPSASLEFEYVVFVRNGKHPLQRITVDRHPGDWEWLKRKCISIAVLREAQLSEWPLGDAGWWCSETWCPAWKDCRGKFYADGWPQVNEPR